MSPNVVVRETVFANGYHRFYSDGTSMQVTDGDKRYYRHHSLHRIDGPAIERLDGNHTWYLYGIKVDPLVHFITVNKPAILKSLHVTTTVKFLDSA